LNVSCDIFLKARSLLRELSQKGKETLKNAMMKSIALTQLDDILNDIRRLVLLSALKCFSISFLAIFSVSLISFRNALYHYGQRVELQRLTLERGYIFINQ
jgi:hypothetical protein